jgi:putative addiction module antidote
MLTLKITQVGNSVGVVLPKEMTAQLNVSKGDTLFVTKTPNGFELSIYDPEVEEQLKEGREFMNEYRETLRALAK